MKKTLAIGCVKEIILPMGVSKNSGTPMVPRKNNPNFNRVWNHYFHHPFWGVYNPYFWVQHSTPILGLFHVYHKIKDPRFCPTRIQYGSCQGFVSVHESIELYHGLHPKLVGEL